MGSVSSVRRIVEEEIRRSGGDLDRLLAFVTMVLQSAQNLTAWSEDEIWLRGIWESVWLLGVAGRVARWVDVGPGAGWPGMVVAIASPSTNVLLIEARRKRADFLYQVAQQLQVTNARVIWGRAEGVLLEGSRWRGWAQVASARAVGSLAASAELTIPGVEVGGRAFLPRGPRAREEVEEVREWLPQLGARVVEVSPIEWRGICLGQVVVLEKVTETPSRFPRRSASLGRWAKRGGSSWAP
jgi:16S rRNA (guanine527-N7)-methyltransferase